MDPDLKRDLFLGFIGVLALFFVLWGAAALAYLMTGVSG